MLMKNKKRSCGKICTNQLLLQDVWRPLRTKTQPQVSGRLFQLVSMETSEGLYVSSSTFSLNVQYSYSCSLWGSGPEDHSKKKCNLELYLSFRCLIRWPQFESQHWISLRTGGDISAILVKPSKISSHIIELYFTSSQGSKVIKYLFCRAERWRNVDKMMHNKSSWRLGL